MAAKADQTALEVHTYRIIKADKPAEGTSNRKNEIHTHTYRTYITTFWCGTTTLLALLVYSILFWGVGGLG